MKYFLIFRHPHITSAEKDLILISLGKKPFLSSKNSLSPIPISESNNEGYNFVDDDKVPIIEIEAKTEMKPKVPIKDIFTSIPVYAIIIGHCCQGWGFYTLLTEMPTYLNQILHFDIKEVSMPFF